MSKCYKKVVYITGYRHVLPTPFFVLRVDDKIPVFRDETLVLSFLSELRFPGSPCSYSPVRILLPFSFCPDLSSLCGRCSLPTHTDVSSLTDYERDDSRKSVGLVQFLSLKGGKGGTDFDNPDLALWLTKCGGAG